MRDNLPECLEQDLKIENEEVIQATIHTTPTKVKTAGGAVVQGNLTVPNNRGTIIFGRVIITRFTFLTTIIILFILGAVTFLVVTSPNIKAVTENKCQPSLEDTLNPIDAGAANVIFMGIGSNIKDPKVSGYFEGWKNDIKKSLNRETQVLYNENKDLSIGIKFSKLDFDTSINQFEACGEEILKSPNDNDRLVSYTYLTTAPSQINSDTLELTIRFKVPNFFLSDEETLYGTELNSNGRLGAPLLISTKRWGDATYRNRVSQELVRRIIALSIFKVGLYYLSTSEYDKAHDYFEKAQKQTPPSEFDTPGAETAAETFEHFAVGALFYREDAKSEPNFDLVRQQYDQLLQRANGGTLCRASVGRASLEFAAVHKAAEKNNFNTSMVQTAYHLYTKALDCYQQLDQDEKTYIQQAELPAQILIGQGQLSALVGLFDENADKLVEARETVQKVIEDFNKRPLGQSESLKPWAAQAYAIVAATMRFDYEQGRLQDLDQIADYYIKAINTVGDTNPGWKTTYVTRLGYIFCLQNKFSQARTQYQEAITSVQPSNPIKLPDAKYRQQEYNRLLNALDKGQCAIPDAPEDEQQAA
jgi:tetratricopeptide (TPR) repeat protein